MRSVRLVTSLLVALFIATIGLPLTAAPQLSDFRAVALTGQPAPGTEPGTVYGRMDSTLPEINAAGQVSFFTFVAGPTVDSSNERALFAGAPGAVGKVARDGDRAPGTPSDVVYNSVGRSGPPRLSGNGTAAFDANLAGPGTTEFDNTGIFVGPIGAPALLARANARQQADGFPAGVNYSFLIGGFGNINDSGQVAFAGSVGPGVATGVTTALWVGTPANIAPVARQGDPAPVDAAGYRYSQLYLPPDAPRLSLNSSGQVAFTGIVEQPPPLGSRHVGVFLGAPGAVRMALLSGDLAPGVPGSPITINDPFQYVRLNDRGDIAFFAAASGNTGIWGGQPDALQLFVLAGTHAAGTPAGVTFTPSSPGQSTFRSVSLAPDGALAFTATLASPVPGTGSTGVWTGQPGAIHLIARAGERVPGETGIAFGDFGDVGAKVAANAAGQVAFSSATGPAADAIYLADPSGTITTVSRIGNRLDVGGGELRTVSGLAFAGAGALNDAGQVTFRATFTDGSAGVFVTVPEPAAPLLVMSATAALLRRIARRLVRKT